MKKKISLFIGALILCIVAGGVTGTVLAKKKGGNKSLLDKVKDTVDEKKILENTARLKSDFPGVIFIAEVYNKDNYRKYIKETGFDLLYDKSGLYDTIRSIVQGQGSAKAITWNWQYLQDLQPSMLNFLENHALVIISYNSSSLCFHMPYHGTENLCVTNKTAILDKIIRIY